MSCLCWMQENINKIVDCAKKECPHVTSDEVRCCFFTNFISISYCTCIFELQFCRHDGWMDRVPPYERILFLFGSYWWLKNIIKKVLNISPLNTQHTVGLLGYALFLQSWDWVEPTPTIMVAANERFAYHFGLVDCWYCLLSVPGHWGSNQGQVFCANRSQ